MTNPFNGETVSTEVAVTNTNAVATNRFEMDGFDVIVDMTSAQLQFCSMQAVTDEDKMKVFNTMNNPDKRLSDCINMKINAKDLFVEIVNCTNEKTGEITACPRIVIVDDKGVSYQAVSIGIYSALKKLIQVFGAPTWEKTIPLEVKQITKGERKMLTLNVAK